MIQIKDGHVTMEGDFISTLAEFTAIINAMNERLTEVLGAEHARETIAECGRLAMLTDEEVKEETEKAKERLFGRKE